MKERMKAGGQRESKREGKQVNERVEGEKGRRDREREIGTTALFFSFLPNLEVFTALNFTLWGFY